MTPLPDVFAVCCFDGDRWVAVSRAPYGRGFDRRELLPGERLHGGDEGREPAIQTDRNRRVGVSVPSALRSDTKSAVLPSRSGAMVRINCGAGIGKV